MVVISNADVVYSVKAGTCWVNCHNMFDAASGFGGYRESGFGRDGGKEVVQLSMTCVMLYGIIY